MSHHIVIWTDKNQRRTFAAAFTEADTAREFSGWIVGAGVTDQTSIAEGDLGQFRAFAKTANIALSGDLASRG